MNINQLGEAKHLAHRYVRMGEMLNTLLSNPHTEALIRLKVDRPGVGMGSSTMDLDFKPEDIRPVLEAQRRAVECKLHALGVTV